MNIQETMIFTAAICILFKNFFMSFLGSVILHEYLICAILKKAVMFSRMMIPKITDQITSNSTDQSAASDRNILDDKR